MKKLICLILLCVVLAGCSASVREVTYSPPTETQIPETTKPALISNPYGPEDFATEGDYLSCLAGAYMLGIDVSSWQGDIDWQQVKDAGVEFVILRLGQRGAEQGLLMEDNRVRQYYEGASAVGLKVGGYFFSQAITPEEAVEEAEFALEIVSGWDLEMPIVYDWEHYTDTGRTVNMDGRTLTDCTVAFCETIRQAGYRPMVYFNKEQSRNLSMQELTEYEWWLALYESDMNYPHKINMWQYSHTGAVPGITDNVDMNLYFIYTENEESS